MSPFRSMGWNANTVGSPAASWTLIMAARVKRPRDPSQPDAEQAALADSQLTASHRVGTRLLGQLDDACDNCPAKANPDQALMATA